MNGIDILDKKKTHLESFLFKSFRNLSIASSHTFLYNQI